MIICKKHAIYNVYHLKNCRLARLSAIRGTIAQEDKHLNDLDNSTEDIQEHKIANSLKNRYRVSNYEDKSNSFVTGTYLQFI